MRIGILISGSGTTAATIVDATRNSVLKEKITVAVVIASSSQAQGIIKMQQKGIPVEVVEKRDFPDSEAFGEKILFVLEKYGVELISQNGWIPYLPKNVIAAFQKKIINQHPGPLDPGHPDFGGKGMYGARVICARLLYCIFAEEKNPWTESDVHFVTEEIDKGDLVRIKKMDLPRITRRISVEDCKKSLPVQEFIKHETKQIQARLLPIEHENVIEALSIIAGGIYETPHRQSPLIPESNVELLHQAKSIAIHLFPNG